jgi:hypothetical protein
MANFPVARGMLMRRPRLHARVINVLRPRRPIQTVRLRQVSSLILYIGGCKSHELHGMALLWNSAAVSQVSRQTSTPPVLHRLLSPLGDDSVRAFSLLTGRCGDAYNVAGKTLTPTCRQTAFRFFPFLCHPFHSVSVRFSPFQSVSVRFCLNDIRFFMCDIQAFAKSIFWHS